MLVLLVLGAAALTVHRLRVQSFKAREHELAERVDARTRDLQQEVAEHKRTETKLHEQMGERERAESDAHRSAERASESNRELLAQREASNARTPNVAGQRRRPGVNATCCTR